MIQLKFSIDKHLLAYRCVLKYFGNASVSLEWSALRETLAKKYDAYPGFLFFDPERAGQGLFWRDRDPSMTAVIRDKEIVERVFQDIFYSDVFLDVYRETEEYKIRIEREWDENSTHVEFYESLIGGGVTTNAEVFVLHPQMETGSYMGENVIEWGNPDFYPNYQVIGLCHEFLHAVTEKQFNETRNEDEKWLLHALIYLSADEELRQKMNGGGEYFPEAITVQYHPRLIETAKSYLPEWKSYIEGRNGRTIVNLYEALREQLS